ncbi:hypothetical protein EON79_18495, partial [bacterium]
VKAISAGVSHCMALRTNGSVVCWGSNASGQLNIPAGMGGATAISAGHDFSMAMQSGGLPVAWGSLSLAEFGLSPVVAIDGGFWHALGLNPNGTVTSWSEISAPQPPAGLSGVTAIAAGTCSYALRGQTIVELDRDELYAGESAVGKVFIPTPAPAGGKTVALSSSNVGLTVPTSVTVPAGARSVTFPISTTLFFGNDRTINLQPGTGLGDTVKVLAQKATLTANTTKFVGGSTTKPSVTLSLKWPALADITFNLSSTNPALTLPASVTIPANESSVKVNLGHLTVPADAIATISAKTGGLTVANLGIALGAFKPVLRLTPVDPDPDTVMSVRVLLNAVNREDVVIALASAHPSIAVPATLTIPAGAREASFDVPIGIDAAGRKVLLTATLNGYVAKATVKVHAYPLVKSLTFPATNYGRTRIYGTVRLVSAAPAGGAWVRIVSSDPTFTVPANVKVLEGQYAATFQVVAPDIAVDTTVGVTASNDASSASTEFVAKPLSIVNLTLSAATVTGGTSLTGTVTLSTDVAAGTSVQLESSDPSAKVPVAVTILANGRTGTFTITTKAVPAAKFVRITARKHASSLYKTVKVSP